MKPVLSIWTAVILLAVLLLVPVSTGAQAERIECIGSEGEGEVLDGGQWISFPNGNIHVRGMRTAYPETSSCPLLSGTTVGAMNANWDATGAGPMWGVADTLNSSGKLNWEGSWQGVAYGFEDYSYQAVMHGVSDETVGMMARLYARHPAGGVTTWTATILVTRAE